MLRASSDPLLLVDGDGLIAAAVATVQVLGAEPEQLVGQRFDGFVAPEDRDAQAHVFDEVLASEQSIVQMEIRILTTQGERRWVEVRADNKLADPEIGAIVVNMHDVTVHRRAIGLLRTREERFRRIAGNLADSFDFAGEEWSVVYASPVAQRLLNSDEADADTSLDLSEPNETAQALLDPSYSGAFHVRARHRDWRVDLEVIVTNTVDDEAVQDIVITARDVLSASRWNATRQRDDAMRHLAAGDFRDFHLDTLVHHGLAIAERYAVVVADVTRDDERWAGEAVADIAIEGGLAAILDGYLTVLVPTHEAVADQAPPGVEAEIERAGFTIDRIAVGSAVGPTALARTFGEVSEMVRVARGIGKSGLIGLRETAVPRAVVHSGASSDTLVQPIQRVVDAVGADDLLPTLRTYLDERLSVHRTAKLLFLHRNSVRARLRRLEEVLGMSIAENRLALELGLIAYDLGVRAEEMSLD